MKNLSERLALYIMQFVITLALLVFSGLQENDEATFMVLGAVLAHWLREGVYVGQGVARNSSAGKRE